MKGETLRWLLILVLVLAGCQGQSRPDCRWEKRQEVIRQFYEYFQHHRRAEEYEREFEKLAEREERCQQENYIMKH